jgi:hypothetical protein
MLFHSMAAIVAEAIGVSEIQQIHHRAATTDSAPSFVKHFHGLHSNVLYHRWFLAKASPHQSAA